MAHTFTVLSEVREPRHLVNIDNIARAVGTWHTLGLRNLEADALDFHIDTGSGDLYAEIDLDPDLISWYTEGVAKEALGEGLRPNAIISWTVSGDSPNLEPMQEVTASLLGGTDFIVWDEIGGARSGW